MSFAELPDDVLEYILLQLTAYGDLQSASRVSRRWGDVAAQAAARQRRLLARCDSFDWYLLQLPSTPALHIAERCSHAAAFDPSGAVYVFGGCTAAYTTFNDLWRFDLASRAWARVLPTGSYPTPKACASMLAYRGQIVLFGGWSKSSPNPIHQTSMFFNELHLFDPHNNSWTQTGSDGPHLAGHSATIVRDVMIVFGGSFGNASSNNVWLFCFKRLAWKQMDTSSPKPSPRYGQSQLQLDDSHLLIVGGCGGPNMIFSDVWLLTISDDGAPWLWRELTVANPNLCAPQLWSHAACKVGEKLVVLSKALRSQAAGQYRQMSSSERGAATDGRRSREWVPPQGNLIPPRRKLLSSRSLDEKEPPVSPRVQRRGVELQRARSIPTIIVGEIPKLVVTKEENSADSAGSSDSSAGATDTPPPSTAEAPRSPCIAMAASSLLPNQAVQVQVRAPQPSASGAKRRSVKDGSRPSSGIAKADRGRQLELLRRMEDYIRSRSAARGAEAAAAGDAASSSKASSLRFRPSSPPPKSKQQRPANFAVARSPMNVYVLELKRALSDGVVSWAVVESPLDAPEDTILYSLVKGRGELIMFGGMRSSSQTLQHGLDVTPFSHTITNETYILRPPVAL